jgi:hypothetical protein
MATFVSRRLRLGPAWTAACRRSPLVVAPALNAATLPASAAALASLGAPRSDTLLARFSHRLSREQEEREIYRGILSTQIKLVKTFSLCTSFIGRCVLIAKAVLLIRIRRIHMLLGLPNPDPLVRYTYPDPSIIKQK